MQSKQSSLWRQLQSVWQRGGVSPQPDLEAPLVARRTHADWGVCPTCGYSFRIHDVAAFDGQRHLRCGQRLQIGEIED